MDLLADENVPRAVILRLLADGHTVLAMGDAAPGTADTDVLAASTDRAFLLLTHDRDFGELAFKRHQYVIGVILLETERLSVAAQVERVAACLADPQAIWVGRFSVIEPGRIRQRSV